MKIYNYYNLWLAMYILVWDIALLCLLLNYIVKNELHFDPLLILGGILVIASLLTLCISGIVSSFTKD